jgi:hypothetical protein
MRKYSTGVLNKLLVLTEESLEKGKGKRLTELLIEPEVNETNDWYMCVPQCFNNALDIRLTVRKGNGNETLVWTQGSAFSFKQGDTLYDTPRAYDAWGESLNHISLCVSVQKASDSIPGKRKTKNSEAAPRYPGSVVFQILAPNPSKTGLIKADEITMTQDEFVYYLINGPDGDLKKSELWK